jgi:hypothetical protein
MYSSLFAVLSKSIVVLLCFVFSSFLVMCIFNRAVVKVKGTNIMVAPLPQNRQLVVYENSVELKKDAEPNAMILPLPLKKGETIAPVNLAKYPNLFAHCEECFTEAVPPQPTQNRMASASASFKPKLAGSSSLVFIY